MTSPTTNAMRSCFPTHLLIVILLASVTTTGLAQHSAEAPRFRSPAELPPARGYSHIVEVPPGTRLAYISGQVALDSAGHLVGAGDFRTQAEMVFANLQRALTAVGATFADVVKLNFYMTDATQLPVLREVRDRYISAEEPPASTLLEVRRLFREDVLLEIDAVAVVPRR